MAKDMQQVYDEANQAYQEAVVIPRAYPPDGDYVVAPECIVEQTFNDKVTKAPAKYYTVIGTITDGDRTGQRFQMLRAGPKMMGSLKEFAELTLGKVTNLAADLEALKAKFATGVQYAVTIVTERSQKDGKDYTNCRIRDIIDGVVAPAAPAAPATPVQ